MTVTLYVPIQVSVHVSEPHDYNTTVNGKVLKLTILLHWWNNHKTVL